MTLQAKQMLFTLLRQEFDRTYQTRSYPVKDMISRDLIRLAYELGDMELAEDMNKDMEPYNRVLIGDKKYEYYTLELNEENPVLITS